MQARGQSASVLPGIMCLPAHMSQVTTPVTVVVAARAGRAHRAVRIIRQASVLFILYSPVFMTSRFMNFLQMPLAWLEPILPPGLDARMGRAEARLPGAGRV